MQNFIQIGLGVLALHMCDVAPFGTKWLGYFLVLEKGYSRDTRADFDTKYVKRRGSAQGSAFWGSPNQNLRFISPFCLKTAILGHIVLTFLLLLPSNRQLNRLIFVSFYSAMTIELVLALFWQSCYVVIVNVFSVILCILCFCILFYIVGSCKCQISGLVVQLLFWANKWWWWWCNISPIYRKMAEKMRSIITDL